MGGPEVFALRAHRATTHHLASAYLGMAGAPSSQFGTALGLEAASGALFCFDPFALYAQGILTNPNLLILGQVGAGKSTLAKILCWSGAGLSARHVAVLDPKGEYGALGEVCGFTHLRLVPGGDCRLDPLDITGPNVSHRRGEIVSALAASVLGRELSATERAVVTLAGETAEVSSGLVGVIDLVLSPTPAMATELRAGARQLAEGAREAGLELRRLVRGDLAGLFDGPSTVRLDPAGPGVVLDLSALYSNPAVLGPTMVAAGAWLTETMARSARQHVLVLDETWAVLSDPGVGRWLRSTMKLARSLGASVVLVTHTLGDFAAVGAAGSEAARLAGALVADTASRAILAQPDAAVSDAVTTLGLGTEEALVLPRLGRGRAIWHVGTRQPVLVNHWVPPGLAAPLDTDARMALR